MEQPYSTFNGAVPARDKNTPLNKQYLIIRHSFMEAFKVQVSSNLFNAEKAALKIPQDNIIELEDMLFNITFGDTSPNFNGAIVSNESFKVLLHLKRATANFVASGLYTNYFLHLFARRLLVKN